MENNRVLKIFRRKLPHDPAVPLLGSYPKDTKTTLKEYVRNLFTAVLLCSCQFGTNPNVQWQTNVQVMVYLWAYTNMYLQKMKYKTGY